MEIWIGRDGERYGPYQRTEIQQWLVSGQLSVNDLAWHEGLTDWQPLVTLFPDLTPSTPPPLHHPSPGIKPPETFISGHYAGFWQRVSAWMIDYIILIIPMSIVFVSTGSNAAFERMMTAINHGTTVAVAMTGYIQEVRPATLIALLIGFIYYVLFECSTWQATPGKRALNLRVTDQHGHRLSLGRAMTRNSIRLLNVISALLPFICYIAMLWSKRKQGLHDMLADTLVLQGCASQMRDPSRQPEDAASLHA